MKINTIYNEDCLTGLKKLADNSIDCCVTSPPYYALRDYGTDNQIGLEDTPEEYIEKLTEVFMEVYRVLKSNGTMWINIGDTYNGSSNGRTINRDADWLKKTVNKNSLNGNCSRTIKVNNLKDKDLIGIPWLLAFSLRAKGWYLRQEIIWAKPNPMPESVTDRCTKSHEQIFLLTKNKKYYFNHVAIQELAAYDGRKELQKFGSSKYAAADTGQHSQTFYSKATDRWQMRDDEFVRNKRDVWTVATKPLKEAHFASYPKKLIRDCIVAGCPENGIVLDPFIGSGTTAIVARNFDRNYIGFELNPEYVKICESRIKNELGMFN